MNLRSHRGVFDGYFQFEWYTSFTYLAYYIASIYAIKSTIYYTRTYGGICV